jgi:hypothetical protein
VRQLSGRGVQLAVRSGYMKVSGEEQSGDYFGGNHCGRGGEDEMVQDGCL